MFIKTFKTSKAELVIILIGLVCFFATLWYIISAGTSGGVRKTSANAAEQPAQFLTVARTAEDRLKFLEQFGWETDAEPLELREIMIPAVFDETYQAYSDMQKPLGFDLEKYKGCRVKKCVYSVSNYPGRPGNVKATLLIYDGRVIGGDISGGGSQKFTHSLLLSQAAEP